MLHCSPAKVNSIGHIPIIAVFTHGFVKKEQKTPKGEIERAISIRKTLRGEK